MWYRRNCNTFGSFRKTVCATDISKDMLEVAKYKCIDFKADVMLSRIDMCDFAVDSQLDLILCL